MRFIIPSTVPSSVHTMKNVGFNLKVLAQWPQGLLIWNDAKCKLTHSQNPSVKAICWIGTLVSKLSLFTWHSHSSFIRSHSSFIFEPLDFLGFKFWKYLRKKNWGSKIPRQFTQQKCQSSSSRFLFLENLAHHVDVPTMCWKVRKLLHQIFVYLTVYSTLSVQILQLVHVLLVASQAWLVARVFTHHNDNRVSLHWT